MTGATPADLGDRPPGRLVPPSRGGRALSQMMRRVTSLAQRLGATRAGVLAIGRIVSPLQRQLYRRTRGRVSLTGRAPVLLLTTVGRRTGRPRTVPIFYLRDGDRLVVCNVNPGFERPNPWTLNLRANPAARVEIRGTTTDVRARPATDDEIGRYWPRLVELWPAYERFHDSGGRRTVFILEPGREHPEKATTPHQQ